MQISEFHFEVPNELIAVEPKTPRSSARLLAYDRRSKALKHLSFMDLPELLNARDLLVFNDSFVIPAKFTGRRVTGGLLEGLLLQEEGEIQARAKSPAKAWIKGRVNVNEVIEIDGFGAVKVLRKSGKEVELACSRDDLAAALRLSGQVPLPPYIVAERERRGFLVDSKSDTENYQSLFAAESENFSIAAPTASLHFDETLLTALLARGVETAKVSLHVGAGTFAPVEAENLDQHQMHSEEANVSDDVWNKILRVKHAGGRVIAVGTTVARTLEAAKRLVERGESRLKFATDLFVRPPFEFKILDGLITNFHWPSSTLIVLVATLIEAKSGRCAGELTHEWRQIYEEAIAQRYQMFSYGDGMVIL